MASSKPYFSPACPEPLVISPETRVAQLKPLLEDEYWKFQWTNIRGLIRLYESGELGPLPHDDRVYVRQGELMDHKPSYEEMASAPVWLEVGTVWPRVGLKRVFF